MKKMNYEKRQLEEQKETNTVLWINTIFTILTGLATLVLTVYQLFYK